MLLYNTYTTTCNYQLGPVWIAAELYFNPENRDATTKYAPTDCSRENYGFINIKK